MIRTSVLATGALLLATSALAGCGFDAGTDRPYTPAAGVDNRDGTVDVLSGMIVSARPGSGTFIAGLSNGSVDKTITFQSLDPVTAADFSTSGSFTPIPIKPMGYVNLAMVNGVPLTGPFTAGQFVTVALGFDDGETATLAVPVVTACDQYAGLDISTDSPTASATGSASPTAGASSETLPPQPTPFPCDDPGGTGTPGQSPPESLTPSPVDPAS